MGAEALYSHSKRAQVLLQQRERVFVWRGRFGSCFLECCALTQTVVGFMLGSVRFFVQERGQIPVTEIVDVVALADSVTFEV